MNVTISIFLLACLTLVIWVLRDSAVRWWLKIAAFGALFTFSTIFWTASETLLGWAAARGLPDPVTLYAAVIKEPVRGQQEGAIYLLVEDKTNKYGSTILSAFGHKIKGSQPRLFWLPYSRKLHEALENDVMPRLRAGQTVRGRFVNDGDNKKGGRKGGRASKDNKAGTGESQNMPEWMFYDLPPSYLQEKVQ